MAHYMGIDWVDFKKSLRSHFAHFVTGAAEPRDIILLVVLQTAQTHACALIHQREIGS